MQGEGKRHAVPQRKVTTSKAKAHPAAMVL